MKHILMIATGGTIASRETADGLTPQLTSEELAWIDEKEAAIAEAGTEFAGGSMQPYAENLAAVRLTRTRVYELAEYLR